jgi:anti-sigma factor (TIGR02949 family)
MRCAQPDADLQAFLDGELHAATAADFRQHVASCPSCQSRLQFFQQVRAELRADTAPYKAPAYLAARVERSLHLLARRRRLAWTTAMAMIAVALLISTTAVYRIYTDQATPALVPEIISVHAATVSGDIALTLLSADVGMVRQWLEQRLPFRPVIPRAAWGGFQLLGARTLSLSGQPAALLHFGRDDRRVSLVNLRDRRHLAGFSTRVELDGINFWIVIQGEYTLVLWSEHGQLYAMVSDDDVDESLEYARLCAQQVRAPT